MVYLPTFTIKNKPNVGKYIIHMDRMGFFEKIFCVLADVLFFGHHSQRSIFHNFPLLLRRKAGSSNNFGN